MLHGGVRAAAPDKRRDDGLKQDHGRIRHISIYTVVVGANSQGENTMRRKTVMGTAAHAHRPRVRIVGARDTLANRSAEFYISTVVGGRGHSRGAELG